jgi:hypothetical protein
MVLKLLHRPEDHFVHMFPDIDRHESNDLADLHGDFRRRKLVGIPHLDKNRSLRLRRIAGTAKRGLFHRCVLVTLLRVMRLIAMPEDIRGAQCSNGN